MENRFAYSSVETKLRLHTKFMISIIIMECLIMAATIFVVERQMRHSILDEFLKRGLYIGKNLAAVNSSYVTTYNYVNIEQSVAKVVEDNGLVYAGVQLFDGEVAAYSGHKDIIRANESALINDKALKSDGILVQYVTSRDSMEEICDIAVPIVVGNKKWATVRIGFSLKDMHAAVLKTRKSLIAVGVVALVFGCSISVLLARRITRPVSLLVKSVEAISSGDYEQEIRINTHDEIGYLGRRFAAMQDTLKEHIELLTDANLELRQTNQRLQRLFEASQAISSLQNLDKLYDLILEVAVTATEAIGGSLTLFEDDHQARIAASIRNNLEDHVLELNKGILKRHLLTWHRSSPIEPDIIKHYLLNLEYFRSDIPLLTLCSEREPETEVLCIPLRQSKNMIGFINLIRKRDKGRLCDSEVQALSVLASHATASLENKKLFLRLEEAYLSSITSLAKTLELKDEYTHGHSERVAEVCMKIGKRMRMDEESLKVLYSAALLHDIGKIGVMEHILNKRSFLDEEEWEWIKRHPEFGEEILQSIPSLKEESRIVRHHHEREDGKGYPDGLHGDQLSLSEKIIIVADSFDAMNSKRPYRAALPPEEIRDELRKHKGSQFDHQVVDAFMEIFNEVMGDQYGCVIQDKVIPLHFLRR